MCRGQAERLNPAAVQAQTWWRSPCLQTLMWDVLTAPGQRSLSGWRIWSTSEQRSVKQLALVSVWVATEGLGAV